jgi:hypothetical protein
MATLKAIQTGPRHHTEDAVLLTLRLGASVQKGLLGSAGSPTLEFMAALPGGSAAFFPSPF